MWDAYCTYAAVLPSVSGVRQATIVENVFDHVRSEHAVTYLEYAQKVLKPDMLRTCLAAAAAWDAATGGVPRLRVTANADVFQLSLTVTKYIALVGKLVHTFGTFPPVIVEVGGGFGGFAHLAAALNSEVSIIDLPSTAAAAANILREAKTGDRVSCIACTDNEAIAALAPGFTVVSEHAWSNFPVGVRAAYAAAVFTKAARGWITWAGNDSVRTDISGLISASGPHAVITHHDHIPTSDRSFGLSWSQCVKVTTTADTPGFSISSITFGGLNKDAVTIG